MPGSTNRGYPYPLGPEQAAGSTDIQALGEAVDADVAAVDGRNPIGVVQAYAGAAAPAGWLMCNGAAVSRTTYAALFAVCGTAYGTGDGSTTFNIPNLTGRFPYGADVALGTAGGAATHTLTVSEMPNHEHDIYIAGGTLYGQEAGGTYPDTWQMAPVTPAPSLRKLIAYPVGGNAPHNNMPPYLALNYIIRAL